MEHLNESFLGVFEHMTEAIRKLGLHAMGIDEEAVRREAMDQLAMGLQCLKTGEEEIRAEYITNGDVQEKAGSSPARHCVARQNPEADPGIPRGRSEGSHGRDDRNTRHGGAPRFSATAGQNPSATEFCRTARQKPLVPTAEEFEAFKERERLKVSLIGPGEALVQEDFLRRALQGIEEILDACPQIRQPFDGGNTVEESATKVYSALRAALRTATRSIEEVDFDTTEAAQ